MNPGDRRCNASKGGIRPEHGRGHRPDKRSIKQIVLSGQYNTGTTWDGANRTQHAAAKPECEDRPAVAYDSVRAQTVLYGGTYDFGESFNDTWVYPSPTMTVNSGTPQFAASGQPYAIPLSVPVKDGNNNPLQGVGATFAAPLFGVGGTFANGTVTTPAPTNASGIATASTFTANATIGGVRAQLDVDGNGQSDPLTDGLLILRYMFGLRGAALISGALAANATRTTANAIEIYTLSVMPQRTGRGNATGAVHRRDR